MWPAVSRWRFGLRDACHRLSGIESARSADSGGAGGGDAAAWLCSPSAILAKRPRGQAAPFC